MTGNVTRFDDRMKRFPAVCPKCGAAIAGGSSGISRELRGGVRDHFRRQHQISIGLAFKSDLDDEPFEFAYLGPVPGLTRRTWYIVSFVWPFEVVQIRLDEWRVKWLVADGPATEGVIG